MGTLRKVAILMVAACGGNDTPPESDGGGIRRDGGATGLDGFVPTVDGGSTSDGGSVIPDAPIGFDGAALGPGEWSTSTRLLEANSECAVAELDGFVYVVGGYPADRVTVDTVQVYNSASDAWRLTTPLPRPLNHTVAAAANGRIYVVGGETDSGGGAYVDDVYEYDPSDESWTSRAPMPTARSAMASAVIGNLIYVAGGRPPQGQDFAVYDAVADEWTELPALPTQRNHLAAAAISGRVHVAGGRFGGGFSSELTDVLEVYDPASRAWSTAAPMPTPRGGVNGIAVGACFYVFGGEHAGGVFEENEMYHAPSNTWRTLAPLLTPIHGVTGAAHLDGYIHAPGGGTDRGGSSGSTLHQFFRVAGTCP